LNEREVFPNAPITEALIDIKVQLPEATNLSILSTYHEIIKQNFPNKKERIAWQGGIEFEEGQEPKLSAPLGGPDGYLFTSSDEKRVVQARMDGFTYSRLKPYTCWEEFMYEAKELWKLYVEIAGPLSISRLGLRYINRIDIPIPIRDFKEYILTFPEIAPEIPRELNDFFMQVVIQDSDIDIKTILTETIDKSCLNDLTIPLIFDIDVFKESKLSIESDFWSDFKYMQELKNRIFFNSVTDKAKELFR
jgi:uncharacterized protein (TIGR04255 family)